MALLHRTRTHNRSKRRARKLSEYVGLLCVIIEADDFADDGTRPCRFLRYWRVCAIREWPQAGYKTDKGPGLQDARLCYVPAESLLRCRCHPAQCTSPRPASLHYLEIAVPPSFHL